MNNEVSTGICECGGEVEAAEAEWQKEVKCPKCGETHLWHTRIFFNPPGEENTITLSLAPKFK